MMKTLAAHIRLRLLQLLKEPSYIVSTMVFPALFFLLFALPNADTPAKARILLASFSAFAVLGVCLFQFGVHHAQEIRTGWYSLLHTLPVRGPILFFAQAFNALVCAVASAAVVYVTVEYFASADLELTRWLQVVGAMLLGAIPFALMAATIANFVSAWAALPVFNLIYILSSFAGGLWMPPAALPAKVEVISRYLPTRHLGEIVWKISVNEPVEWKYAFYLFLFALVMLAALLVSQRYFSERQKI